MSAAKGFVQQSLKSKLVELIRLRGPMTVADYMKIVLTNPETGFYMNNDVFGVKGHFTTSPEISQMFGEVLGVWILQEWRRFGCPKPLRLVEFGPGRGTLMSDITRTLSNFERAPNSIQIRMVEISPKLREIQRQTLAKQSEDLAKEAKWLADIDEIDEHRDGFTTYIAHEFLDALPIHKFVRDPKTNSWRELLIDYNSKEELRFCIARQPSLSTRLLIPENFQGDHIEVCPQAALHLERVSKRLNATSSGCMLVCDYGFEDEPNSLEGDKSLRPARSNRDTFRAFKNHEAWPPLRDPGQADLTADVDFRYLKNYLKDKAVTFGSVDQKGFLTECGIQARLNVLLENTDDDDKKELISAMNLLMNEMGNRYRFLAIFPKGCEPLFDGDPPAGFCRSVR